MLGTDGMWQSLKFSKFWSKSKKWSPAADNFVWVLFCIIMSTICKMHQNAVLCLCRKFAFNLFLWKSTKKLLQLELLLLAQICTKSFVGWVFASSPNGGAYTVPRPPSWFRGWGPPGEGRERKRGTEGEGQQRIRSWTPQILRWIDAFVQGVFRWFRGTIPPET